MFYCQSHDERLNRRLTHASVVHFATLIRAAWEMYVRRQARKADPKAKALEDASGGMVGNALQLGGIAVGAAGLATNSA
jgi:hypothetical protein